MSQPEKSEWRFCPSEDRNGKAYPEYWHNAETGEIHYGDHPPTTSKPAQDGALLLPCPFEELEEIIERRRQDCCRAIIASRTNFEHGDVGRNVRYRKEMKKAEKCLEWLKAYTRAASEPRES